MPFEFIPCYEFAMNVKTFETREWETSVNSIVKDYGTGYRDDSFTDFSFDAVRGWSCYSPQEARGNAWDFCIAEISLLKEVARKINEVDDEKV
jgi:hypothetical protein